MRILSVRVRNVRMHTDRTIHFDRERTLVAGPNEAGKSTIVDAIERVLCYPFRSTADNLEGLKPRSGGGAPEVVLTFEQLGRTYTIHKVFKGQQSSATLSDDSGDRCMGDAAEERLRTVLGFEGGPLRNRVLGWSHLWARQGQAASDPTDRESLGEAAKRLDGRLQNLAGTAMTESERDTETFDRIAKEYDATFTAKGDPKAGSPLAESLKQLASAQEAAAQAAGRLAEFEAAADAVIREDDLIQESQSTLADADRRLGDIRGILDEIERLEAALAIRRRDAQAADAAHADLEQGDADIRSIASSIDARAGSLASREGEVARLRAHEQRLQDDLAEALAAIERSNESQRLASAQEDLLRAVSRVFTLDADRTQLESTLSLIAAHRAEHCGVKERLIALADIDRATVDALEDLDRRVEVGLGRLEAGATRIEVMAAGDDAALDGLAIAAGDSKTLTEPAVVSIGDRTALRITPGGGESFATLRATVADLRNQLASRLDAIGLKDVAMVRATMERRNVEQAQLLRLEEKIGELDGDAIRRRLDEATSEHTRIEAEIARKQSEGFERPKSVMAVQEALERLQARRIEADEAVKRSHVSFERITRESKETQHTRENLEKALSDERRLLRDFEVRKAVLETVHGLDREPRIRQLAEEKVRTLAEAADTERRLAALNPDTVRSDRERFDRTVKVSTERIHEATVRRAAAEGELRRSGTADLHATKAAADARLDMARRRHAEVDRRAVAIRRLRELFEARRQAVADIVAAPLRAKVTEYLDALFGVGTRVRITKTGDTFDAIRVARPSLGGLEFAFEELSGGTREQVATACRLAMAEVLAGSDGVDDGSHSASLPMVFDDAFVHSDPDRIRAVQRVLDLGARRGLQIIVLSCTPQDYGSLGATRIDLPPPRFTPSADPAATGAVVNGHPSDRPDMDGVDSRSVKDGLDAAGGGILPRGDAALADEFRATLQTLAECRASNKALRERLGWDTATYERIKNHLVSMGLLKLRRGPGGGVELVGGGGARD